jgi:hypothetical protein
LGRCFLTCCSTLSTCWILLLLPSRAKKSLRKTKGHQSRSAGKSQCVSATSMPLFQAALRLSTFLPSYAGGL